MTDTPNPDPAPNPPAEPSSNPNAPRPTGRPLFESTLLPPRKHRRVSPWLVIPGLLLLLAATICFLIFGPKPRRAVNTAGMVAYASDAGSPGVPHIWIAHADGTGAHPLTSGAAADTSPAFTADGNQIAFLSNRGGRQNQIYVMDGDGKNMVPVTHGSGAKSQPVFAPGSNTLLGFLSGPSLAVINVGKGDASILLPPPTGQSARPDSSDPSQATEAVSTVVRFAWRPAAADPENPGLAAVLDTGGIQTLAVLPTLDSAPRVTQNDKPDGPPLAAADAIAPAWTPDGSKMAVALLHVQGLTRGRKASGLVQFDAQGNVQNPLIPILQDPAIGPLNPLYSPDGSLLAFEMWRQTDLTNRACLGLFLLPTGAMPKTLAQGDAGSAQFSLDGRQIFFLGRRPDGGRDLYRASLDAAGVKRLSDGHADIASYAVSPQTPKP